MRLNPEFIMQLKVKERKGEKEGGRKGREGGSVEEGRKKRKIKQKTEQSKTKLRDSPEKLKLHSWSSN